MYKVKSLNRDIHSQPSPVNRLLGSCNADVDEIYISRHTELRFMWWQLVIDYPRKSFDNYHSQALKFKRAFMD